MLASLVLQEYSLPLYVTVFQKGAAAARLTAGIKIINLGVGCSFGAL